MIKKLIEIFACSVLLFGSHFLRGMDAAPAPATPSALVKIKAPDGKEIQVSEQFFNSCQTLKKLKEGISWTNDRIDMSTCGCKELNSESLSQLDSLHQKHSFSAFKAFSHQKLKQLETVANYLQCAEPFLNALTHSELLENLQHVPNIQAELAHKKKSKFDMLKKLEQAADFLNCDKTFITLLSTAAKNPLRKTPETATANTTPYAQMLDLSNQQLEALTSIQHKFQMTNITTICVNNNYLRTINLGKLLAVSPHLQRFYASNCQTKKLKLDRKLPDGFELNVSNNELTDKVVLPLLHLLNREGCLVNLTGNRLSDDAITKIKKALQPTFLQRRRTDFDNFAIKYTHNLFFPLAHTAIYLGGALGIGAYYAYNSMSVKSFTFYFVSGGHGLVQTSSLIGLLFWGKYRFINPIKPPIIITKSQKK